MGILIAAILFGIGFAFLATQNTTVVSLRAGTYAVSFPLFAVVLGAMLIGLFIAWFLNAIGWISNSITLHKKDSTIRETQRTIDHLETRVQELEFENNRLRDEKHIARENNPEDEGEKGFFHKLNPNPHHSTS